MQKNIIFVLVGVMLLAASGMSAVADETNADKKEFDQKKVLQETWEAGDDVVVGTADGGIEVTKGEALEQMWKVMGPQFIGQYLRTKVIEKAAKDAGIEITDDIIKQKMQEIATQFGVGSVEQLLKEKQATYYALYEGAKTTYFVEKLAEKEVDTSDAELAQWLKASHILIKLDPAIQDEKERDESALAKAEDIKKKLDEGADFAETANEYTQDPGNTVDGEKMGGSIGWFTKGGVVKAFEEKAYDMKVGEISEPVKSVFGYHIIKLDMLGKDAKGEDKDELIAQVVKRSVPALRNQVVSKVVEGSNMDNKIARPVPKAPVPQPGPAGPNDGNTPPPPPAPKPGAEPAKDKPSTPPPPPPPGN